LPQPPRKKKKTRRAGGNDGVTFDEGEPITVSKKAVAEEARLQCEFIRSGSQMNFGDMLVIGGNVPHRGLADKGHSKIYYNFEPKSKLKEPYEHQSQVDALEVWVMIGAYIFEKLDLVHRVSFLRHICFSFAIVRCNEHVVYTRYTHMGVLYVYFQALENVYTKISKRLKFNLDDPKKMFTVNQESSEESDFQSYLIVPPLEKILDMMHRFTITNKWEQVDKLFTYAAKPLNITKYIVKNAVTDKTKVVRGKSVALCTDGDKLTMNLSESDKRRGGEESLKSFELTDSSVLKIEDHPNKNTYVLIKTYETDDASTDSPDEIAEESKSNQDQEHPTMIADDEQEEEEDRDCIDISSSIIGVADANDKNVDSFSNLSHYTVSLLETKSGTKISPQATRITEEMSKSMNIVQIIQKSITEKNKK
jgi:hypothetical protein